MLATLTKEPLSDKDWIFERKLDGERCLTFRHAKTVRFMSRNKKRLNNSHPELADALARQPATDFIVDGEIVAFKKGITSSATYSDWATARNPIV